MQFFTNSVLANRTLDNSWESLKKLRELDGPWLRITRWALGSPCDSRWSSQHAAGGQPETNDQ